MATLSAAFDTLLRLDPGAIVCRSPRRSVSRAEIATLAERIEQVLSAAARQRGGEMTGPGVIALALPNGPLLLAAFLALRRAGRCVLLLDVALPEAARAAAARRLGARALISRRAGTGADDERALLVESLARQSRRGPPAGTDLLKVSSGSTGSPRAIAFAETQVLADARALTRAMRVGNGDRALAIIPMSFSYGLSSLLVPALVEGLELIVPEDEGPLAPLAAAHACAATFLPAVPVLLGGLQRLESARLPESLRLVISAGAPLAPAAARAFAERFGRRVHVFYGASECGGICYDPTGEAALRGTVGRPLEGVNVGLVGDDATVVVESEAVALGYVPQEIGVLTEGRFVTSDCGRLEGGELRLLGRKSECINVDGRKVHPREIENLLARLPGVLDVAVVRDDGSELGGEACWALIASAPGTVSRAQVLAFCRERLPPYKVPRRISLLASLPRGARGKLDREALHDLE